MSTREKIAIGLLALVVIVGGLIFYFYGPYGQAASLRSGTTRVSLFAYPNRVDLSEARQAKIIAVLTKKKQPVANETIYFSTSAGKLSDNQQTTDSSGQAVVNLENFAAGNATVTANSGGASKTISVNFVK